MHDAVVLGEPSWGRAAVIAVVAAWWTVVWLFTVLARRADAARERSGDARA